MSSSNSRLNSIYLATTMLTVVALFLTVVGASASTRVTALTPGHSHVFLSAEAAMNHNHHDHVGEESGVVNVGSHSTSSVTTLAHVGDVDASPTMAGLTVTAIVASVQLTYSDQFLIPAEHPPRYS